MRSLNNIVSPLLLVVVLPRGVPQVTLNPPSSSRRGHRRRSSCRAAVEEWAKCIIPDTFLFVTSASSSANEFAALVAKIRERKTGLRSWKKVSPSLCLSRFADETKLDAGSENGQGNNINPIDLGRRRRGGFLLRRACSTPFLASSARAFKQTMKLGRSRRRCLLCSSPPPPQLYFSGEEIMLSSCFA